MNRQRLNGDLVLILVLAALLACLGGGPGALGQEPPGAQTRIGIEERLGATLPLDDLEFKDEEGKPIKLRELFDRPVALTHVYYRCPGICTPLLLELAHAVGQCDLKPGEDYRLVTISFDPTEGSELAKNKKNNLLAEIKNREVPRDAWRFLVGDAENIRRVTELTGFRYARDRNQVDYVHAATVILLSREGTIVRYLNGVTVNPVELKMAILDAREGRPRSFMSRIGELCYGYDPAKGSYVLKVNRIILAVMGVLLVGFLAYLVRKGKTRKAFGQPPAGGAS